MRGKKHIVDEIDWKPLMDLVKVRGKMYLLDRDFSKLMDALPQVVNDVYDNFTFMANVICDAMVDFSPSYLLSSNIQQVKGLIGIIRWALKWCVNDRGATNKSFVDILADIEAHFVECSKLIIATAQYPGANRDLLWRRFHIMRTSDLFNVGSKFISWVSLEPSISLFSEESVMERLNQWDENIYKSHREECVFLEKFVHFLKEHTDGASWGYIHHVVECALDMMSLYDIYSFDKMFLYGISSKYSHDVAKRIDDFIHVIILHILVRNSGSTPTFTDELLVAYVECLEKSLISLPNKSNYQVDIVRNVLSLVRTFVNDTHKHKIDWEILSHTKMHIDASLRKLGCIFSCEFDGDKAIFEISDWLIEIFPAFTLPLNTCGFLSNDTLLKYAYYFRHYRFQLPKNENINVKFLIGDQCEFDKDLVFVARIVFTEWSECHVEQEMLFTCRVEMVGVLGECASIMSLSISNKVERNIPIPMNPGLPHVIAKLERFKILFSRTIVTNMFKSLQSVENPKTDFLGFLDFFIQNLKELGICNLGLIRDWKDQLQTIQDDLVVLRSFLHNFNEKSIKDDRLHDLSIRIRNAAYNAEYVINACAVGAFHVSCKSLLISDLVIQELNLLKENANFTEVLIEKSSDVLPQELVPATSMSSRVSVPPIDIFVGLEPERKRLMNFLASNEMQLDVISVVGMGGIGKTTLAKKVYEERFTVNHFHLRAWCCVSQEYDMKNVLLSILGIDDVMGQEKSFDNLSLMLHKKLTGRKYLIVLDDVWNISVFNELKRYFPNDANGSRIVLTSRSIAIGLYAKHHSETIELHPLSNDESWNILKQKVFPKEECPVELVGIGNRIARKCGGLPLAVVVIAGILAKSDKEKSVWEEVAKGLNIYTVEDTQGEGGMKALDLSYELLPDHLKPLFLYVGAFPEDYEIPTKNLKWIWIAEGFIRQETEKNKSLEDQAETFLMNLIDRSLLLVGKRNSIGSVKTCHIHDLMREMSVRKAEEENFMQHHNIGYKEHLQEQHLIYPRRVSVSWSDSKEQSTSTSSIAYEAPPRPPITYKDLSRLSMSSRLNSLMLFRRARGTYEPCKSIFQIHKMLRVFHTYNVLPEKLFDNESLPVYLRYISVRVNWGGEFPSSLFSSSNLETLIITTEGSLMEVPGEIWKMVKLRHLHIKWVVFSEPDEDSYELENLQTLSTPSFVGELTKMIERFPNLLHLNCILDNDDGKIKLSDWLRLDSLHQLESATMCCWGVCTQLSLPSTLKKLSLSEFRLKWNDISSFQELPNLEVLKLKWWAVEDELWDMEGIQFPKLKFLKLDWLILKQWIASDENFPSLQNLLLYNLHDLDEIPSGLGDICSLEKIEVSNCSHSASESAKRIQQDQLDYGNGELKISVSRPYPKQKGD